MRLSISLRVRRLALLLALIACEKESGSIPADSSSLPVASSSSAAATTPSDRASACGDEIITDEGIGQVRIGAGMESVQQKCNVVRDTTVVDVEGMPSRRLAVAFSRDTVQAEIVDGRVWRIAVLSPGLRTADSLGVGTSIARLLQLKDPHGMTGEGQFFVASPAHCGKSFRLAIAEAGPARGELDQAGLARLPRSTAVNEVLIFGCHQR
jgi:hypothetical protein